MWSSTVANKCDYCNTFAWEQAVECVRIFLEYTHTHRVKVMIAFMSLPRLPYFSLLATRLCMGTERRDRNIPLRLIAKQATREWYYTSKYLLSLTENVSHEILRKFPPFSLQHGESIVGA